MSQQRPTLRLAINTHERRRALIVDCLFLLILVALYRSYTRKWICPVDGVSSQAYVARMYAMQAVRSVSRSQLDYAHYTGLLLRWDDRRCLGNMCIFAELYCSAVVGALNPDSAAWRRYIAALATVPIRILRSLLP